MIDDKTIKSLYDDKPTLLEWLKRVEAQLEELKKVTNFDTLTANNAEVNQKLDAQNIHAGKGELDELLVKDAPVAKAIYLHRITLKYEGEDWAEKYYLSANGQPYKSLAEIFADKGNNSLSYGELFGSAVDGTFLLFYFGTNGSILFAASISAGTTGSFVPIDISEIDASKDEVIGGWGA